MIKRLLFLALFYVLSPSNSFSDDSAVEIYSGTAKLMSTHSSIQMIGEDVTIILSTAANYDVDAIFRFYNEGKSTTVLVGFPMSGFDPGEDYSAGEFKSFYTSVNNEEVSVSERYDQFERSGVLIDAKWKVKEVYFPQNMETVTRVKYTAPYGERPGVNFVNYIIGTGASWHGNIGPSTFTVIFPDNLNLDLRSPFSKNSVLLNRHVFTRTKNKMVWITPEFKPKEREFFSFDIYAYRQPWEDSQYSNKLVGSRLQEKLTLQQLKILRNEMFAVHGRVFTDPVLKKYFSSKTWYSPKEDFAESSLTSIERKNVKRILEYEKYLMSLPEQNP
jgi:hypothetical protein